MSDFKTTVFRAVLTKKYRIYAGIGLFFLRKVSKKRIEAGKEPLLSSFDEDRYFRELIER